MKERMKRCFEKNSVLLFFVSFRQKNLTNFVCLFFFCFLFFCNKKTNIFFSRVFLSSSTPQITQIKKEREQKHLKRERERESAQQMRGKGGRALPLAISKGCLSSSSFEEE